MNPAWTPVHEFRRNFPFPGAAQGPSLHFPDNLCSHEFWCLSKQSSTSSLCYIRAWNLNRRSSLQGVELNTRDFRKNTENMGAYLFIPGGDLLLKGIDVVYSFWKWCGALNNFSALLWHQLSKEWISFILSTSKCYWLLEFHSFCDLLQNMLFALPLIYWLS